jgi:hypothetical protein
MKFYKLVFDMDNIDASIKEGTNTIYAETTNMDEIVYQDVKKGFFDNIILSKRVIDNWPNVEFYYSSKVSSKESDYLLNIKRWPVVHKKVMNSFIDNDVSGIKYYPIRLIDVVTQETNNDYYLMYVDNFVEAFDMEKSQYRHNEKYDMYTFAPHETYLDTEVCSKYEIFRCNKSVASLYVSEKIKRLIEENQFTGFAFYEQKSN